MLPSLTLFRSVNGFDKQETTRALANSHMKYHLMTYCSFTRFGTFGSLANYLTKFYALQHQVSHRLPFMAMLEDDMWLKDGFGQFVEAAVKRHFAGHRGNDAPDLIVLGTWGEGYVTSLNSARRVLRSLQRQGIPQNVDIMLNEGHAGRAVRVDGAPWAHRVYVNDGDCLRTAHIGLRELPRALVHIPPRCTGRGGCLEQYRAIRQQYCHPPGVQGQGQRQRHGGRALATRGKRKESDIRWVT